MDKRFTTFLLVAFVVLMVNMQLMRWWQQKAAPAAQQAAQENAKLADKPAAGAADKQPELAAVAADEPADEKAAADVGAEPKKPAVLAPPPQSPEQRLTLGSADPKSGFRELVTFTSAGAAVQRVELNSPQYLDQEDRSGYLGQLDLGVVPNHEQGALVRVVGPGTPADEAGLKVDDVITELNGNAVLGPIEFQEALEQTEPGDEFTLTINRHTPDGAVDGRKLNGTLRRRPMEVIRPEGIDALSFLLTIDSLDGERIAKDAEELPGIMMRTSPWQVLPRVDPDEIAFQYDLAEAGLSVIKKFRLGKVDPAEADNPSAKAYHLDFAIEVRNTGDREHKLAWRLDGPTGLPLEGAWYAMKISPNMRGGAGMRDVVVGFLANRREKNGLVSAYTIAEGTDLPTWQDDWLKYIGVDAQYFAVALLPASAEETDNGAADETNYGRAVPIRVGDVPADRSKLNRTNVSFRLISKVETVAPQGKPFAQSFKIFSGPKKPALLAHYGLGNLVYYGWFGWVAQPMLEVLHFFYRIIPNYGIAIIMLTVLVRSMMFPLSRRQALNAQKMQELQPEIKRIQEKYKGNMEARSKAQQELFRKHKYNPLAGCLPVFLQLPIFLGLYRSLSVDVELRGAPLISESIRWCSNLAAPDMLWNWHNYLPAVLAGPSGWLGPYFNLLPCITIGLFIWQQKMFMPPAADEQAAMQQKMMQYMMIFMGVMFFKVASGLCLYFIASSLWGITERKLLPKSTAPAGGASPTTAARGAVARTGANGNGSSETKKKNRGRA
ncbi:MAG TPA: YidC/Oxa1 family insertase periplasmic-domain containing protein [Pirellulales bacterium]|jgi:YidC/Oxa1 family membrane protein insertase